MQDVMMLVGCFLSPKLEVLRLSLMLSGPIYCSSDIDSLYACFLQ